MAYLSQLLAVSELDLELIQAGPRDPKISWVSVTELLNLSDYLEGGEVIMTTGLALAGDDPRWLDFVADLSRARIAAIGFGVGVNHERIPAPLVQAASTYRVALFKIPLPVPFVAVSKAVAELLRLDELRATHTALRAQRRILEGARDEQEPAEILASVAQATGRQLALVAARDGEAPEASPISILASTAGFTPGGAEFISLDADNALHLAIAGGAPLTPEGSSVVAAGAMVLGLGMHGGRAVERRERERWQLLTARILSGSLPLSAAQILAPGTPTPSTVRVLAVSGPPDNLASWRDEAWRAADRLIAANEELAAGLARAWQVTDGARTDTAVARAARHGLCVVVGRETPGDRVPVSLRSAQARLRDLPKATASQVPRQAPRQAPRRAPTTIWADRDAPFLEAVLGLASSSDSGSLSRTVLGPLSIHLASLESAANTATEEAATAPSLTVLSDSDRMQLRETLRAVFEADGQRGPAANALGIHRNTLRDRITRIEKLTGRTISSAADRAELWFALQSEELA